MPVSFVISLRKSSLFYLAYFIHSKLSKSTISFNDLTVFRKKGMWRTGCPTQPNHLKYIVIYPASNIKRNLFHKVI